MEKHKITQLDRIARYADLIQKQAGKAVRPYRADGYVNMMTRYGTQKDASEQYKFVPEDAVTDELLTMYYEGNGLFAKIIDTPAEEAIKHGFELKDVSDQAVEDFYTEALDELDWEETAMTAIKWARLFGGSLAVMLINDGRGLDEPLDWRHIQSIDDIRVFDRSVIQPDYTTLFNYDPRDPFSTRGSRLGLPEYYQIFSKYGSFTVHDSRCLVFQNGILPENTTNSIYQFWGVPEYIRLHRAIRDAEVAHRSAPKMLDRSVQPIYKMQNLAAELATEEGESKVLRRLQVIDMARGLLNSLVIDAEGEDYDFKTFQFSGINDVVSASCNMLSALSNIPQTILFGQAVGGMSSTDDTSMENYYNYVERIQRRMLKSNLRYLLSIIFQAGLATGEVDEVPKIKIKFNPLWSLSDVEQADLEQKREQTKFTRAQTAQIYVNMQAIDPSEVRQKLADSEEFDVEAMLDEYDDDELFPDQIAGETPVDTLGQPVQPGTGTSIFEEGDFAEYGQDVSVEEHNADPETGGNAPAAAPAATKLPQDMSAEELAEKEENGVGNTDGADGIINRPKESVGVLVISDGKVLSGTRHNDFGYGLVCGPGGHVEPGETPTQAAFRETEEEFGISPKELIPLGLGPYEPDTGLRPHLYLCTDYDGEPNCLDLEMTGAKFRTMEELDALAASMFQPFADGLKILKTCIDTAMFFGDDEGEIHDDLVDSIGKAVNGDLEKEDGGPGSGNHGHKGVPGEIGGSAPASAISSKESAGSLLQKINTSRSGTLIRVSANGKSLFSDGGSDSELRVVRNKHSVEKLVDTKTGKEYTTADALMRVVQSQSNDFDLLVNESDCPESLKSYTGEEDIFASESFSSERKENAKKCYSAAESEIAYGDVAKNISEIASPNQKYAAFMYLANSTSINGLLRGEKLNPGLEELCKKTSDDLSALIDKSSYDADVYVQRGVTTEGLSAMLGCNASVLTSGDIGAIKNEIVGSEYTDRAFTSTGAAIGTGLTDRNVQMRIYCPKGTKMLYLNRVTGADDEAQNEMLIQRGTSYRVTGIERLNNGKLVVDAEVIGQIGANDV